MVERRRVQRHRTLKSGKVLIDPKTSALDCTVRNLSPSGALLMISSIAVPDQFALVLSATRARHECRVVWRAHDRVGVEFADA